MTTPLIDRQGMRADVLEMARRADWQFKCSCAFCDKLRDFIAACRAFAKELEERENG